MKTWDGTKIKRHRKPNDDTGFIRRIGQNIKSIAQGNDGREGKSKWD